MNIFKKMYKALLSLLKVISNRTSEPDLMQAGIESLVSLIKARYGAIAILNEAGDLVKFVYTGITQEQAHRIGHFPEGKGLLGVVINTNQTLNLKDIVSDPRSAGFPPHHPVMKSLLAVPISCGNRIYGRIYLSDKLDDKPFDAHDETLVENFAHSLSLMVRLNKKEP